MKNSLKALLLLGLPQISLAAAVEKIKPEFAAVAEDSAALQVVASGLQFTEGPVWIGSREGRPGYLLFSDIPANTIYRWAPGEELSVWRKPSGNSNGLLLDSQGRLLACEHGGRRVSLSVSKDSAVTLCDHYKGLRLSSPNDIALSSDGSLWFTDPPYGLVNEKPEQPANYVYRLAPGKSEPSAVVGDFNMPNGIVFSPDKKLLYISDSGKPHHIRKFKVAGDSLVSAGIFAVISPGGPDGMCIDTRGRLFTSAGDGIQVFSPEGVLIGKILTQEQPTNCCFGGDDWQTLFITARSAVYAIHLKVQGLP